MQPHCLKWRQASSCFAAEEAVFDDPLLQKLQVITERSVFLHEPHASMFMLLTVNKFASCCRH